MLITSAHEWYLEVKQEVKGTEDKLPFELMEL